ncbi:hypothetical protein PR048_032193 [Dryococelus australis]|uniref:Uncharacterized protein n=1 Tax=Dryococelus australis TaxID=614101 RepID=A0ABQ9G1J5_9NEOP|nr:hypothetical protein PR048_032193 [Dryococelus australis]
METRAGAAGEERNYQPDEEESTGRTLDWVVYQLGSPLVDDRPITNVAEYRSVSGVVWANRTMRSVRKQVSYRLPAALLRFSLSPLGADDCEVGGGVVVRQFAEDKCRERICRRRSLEVLHLNASAADVIAVNNAPLARARVNGVAPPPGKKFSEPARERRLVMQRFYLRPRPRRGNWRSLPTKVEPGSIPGPRISNAWEPCPTVQLDDGFSRGSPVYRTPLANRRYSMVSTHVCTQRDENTTRQFRTLRLVAMTHLKGVIVCHSSLPTALFCLGQGIYRLFTLAIHPSFLYSPTIKDKNNAYSWKGDTLKFVEMKRDPPARLPPSKPGSIPSRVTGFSRVEILPYHAIGRRVFSGSPVSPTLSSRRHSILTVFALIGSQDLAVKRPLNLFTLSIDTDYMSEEAPKEKVQRAEVRRLRRPHLVLSICADTLHSVTRPQLCLCVEAPYSACNHMSRRTDNVTYSNESGFLKMCVISTGRGGGAAAPSVPPPLLDTPLEMETVSLVFGMYSFVSVSAVLDGSRGV